MHPPHRTHRRILLAVTGLSPQIVTETLYALAVARKTPWTPTEIHLITTAEGAQRARLSLLSAQLGWFHRLRKDFALPDIAFDETRIHPLQSTAGEPLDDIRSPADNEAAADSITALVRELTADPTSELHASIAGGRKTMGYYLGYALSLFGRPQDRLSHVLVSEPFESSWNFFYPTPYSQVIETRDNALADTHDAQVTLAEIPFVSLRQGLPTRLQQGAASFTQTVAVARKAMAPPTLTIDLQQRTLTAGDEAIAMKPADLAFYAMLARRKTLGLHPLNHKTQGLGPQYLNEYAGIVGKHSGDYEKAEKTLADDDLKDWFDQRKSKTNRAIKTALGDYLAQPYLITPSGKRPHTRYSLNLPPEAIELGDGKLVVPKHL